MQAEALNFILSQIQKAFNVMASFEVYPGISVLFLLIVCLVFHLIFNLFLNHMPKANLVDSASDTVHKVKGWTSGKADKGGRDR